MSVPTVREEPPNCTQLHIALFSRVQCNFAPARFQTIQTFQTVFFRPTVRTAPPPPPRASKGKTLVGIFANGASP